MDKQLTKIEDPWEHLKTLTAARIALGRAGASLPTRELLDFGLAHAKARDAVRSQFLPETIQAAIYDETLSSIVVQSAARTAADYLCRPDLGRRLAEEDRVRLKSLAEPQSEVDLVVIVADGLSATAANHHAAPVINALMKHLRSDAWGIAPLIFVQHGRVAIEDEIGEIFGAQLALILIGERPGLGAADSLGAYLVYTPQVGKHDAERNCLSNIRPTGHPPDQAAETLHYLLSESRRRKLSGVGLKDERNLLSGPSEEKRIV